MGRVPCSAGGRLLTTPSSWICHVCKKRQERIWCFVCDIHFSGKTLRQMREEKAVNALDIALAYPKLGHA
jgi:hypothetical protein